MGKTEELEDKTEELRLKLRSLVSGKPAHLLHPAPIRKALPLCVSRSSKSFRAVAKIGCFSSDRSSGIAFIFYRHKEFSCNVKLPVLA